MTASTTTAPAQFVFKRLPADDEELWWTVYALWGYRIPRTTVCPEHTAPFQAFADAYFARTHLSIWKASRGLGGKSRTLAILGLTEATLLGCEVSILGGSGGQSKNVHDATKDAWSWHAAPKALLARDPTTFDTLLKNGGHLRTLTASQTSVRGPHPPRLRCDEIDEMEQDILDAALGQPMEQRNYLGDMVHTQSVLSSTHQYPDKTMTEMIRRAKKAGWPVHEWCYRDTSNPVDGWLTAQAIQRAREVVSEIMWKTEYDLQEPSFAGRAIDTDAVDRCFDKELGEFGGDKPIIGHAQQQAIYLTAADWAKEKDWTIVATFDTSQHPWVCVGWQKIGRLPWPVLVRKAVGQWKHYGGKFVHDRGGTGQFVDDLIREEVGDQAYKMCKGIDAPQGRAREAMFTDYIAAIEHDDIRYPRIDYAYAEHKYVTTEDLYGKGHAPDSFIAGALAWSERKKKPVKIFAPTGMSRSASPWQV